MARLEVDEDLLQQLKEKYAELVGMTYTALVEWAIRKAIKEA